MGPNREGSTWVVDVGLLAPGVSMQADLVAVDTLPSVNVEHSDFEEVCIWGQHATSNVKAKDTHIPPSDAGGVGAQISTRDGFSKTKKKGE